MIDDLRAPLQSIQCVSEQVMAFGGWNKHFFFSPHEMAIYYNQTHNRERALHAANMASSSFSAPPRKHLKPYNSRASAVDFVADTSPVESEDDVGSSDYSSNSDDFSNKPGTSITAHRKACSGFSFGFHVLCWSRVKVWAVFALKSVFV